MRNKKITIGSKSALVPKNRLEEFIRLDIKSPEAILDYSQKYKIVSFFKTDMFIKDFKKEYRVLAPIYWRATKNELSDADIKIINKKLSFKKEVLTKVSSDRIDEINSQIVPATEEEELKPLLESNKDTYMKLWLYTDSYTGLWTDLVDRITINKYKICKNCGVFFEPERSNKIFCLDRCRSNYHYKSTK
jgi:hypothetical protein